MGEITFRICQIVCLYKHSLPSDTVPSGMRNLEVTVIKPLRQVKI